MPGDKHSPSPRIYLAKRHREWFYGIPRFERSKIINEALDVWRDRVRSSVRSEPSTPVSNGQNESAGDTSSGV